MVAERSFLSSALPLQWASSVGALDCLEVLLARAPLHLADLTRTGDSIWTIAILTNQMAVRTCLFHLP
jgi:hypothetical protein